MPFVAHFEQASGGGGHECHLLFVSSRGVVVVSVNAVYRLFRAGKWWWKYTVSRFEGGRDIAWEWRWWALVVFSFDSRREESGGKSPHPSRVSREGGT